MKNIAIIGCGYTSQLSHIPSFINVKNCKIIALVEKRINLGKHVCKKYKIKNCYLDYKEMYKKHKKNLDAVIIIVRREETYEIAKFFLSKNINVFSEKPMAKTSEEALKLVEIARKKKLIYQIGYNKLFYSGMSLAKKLLTEKKLGKIIYFRYVNVCGTGFLKNEKYIKSNDPYSNTPENKRSYPKWLSKKNYKLFDEYLNTNSHAASLLRYFFGEFKKVILAYLKKKSQVVLIEYKNFYGIIESKHYKDFDWDLYLKIYYENGFININFPRQQDKKKGIQVTYKLRGKKKLRIFPKTIEWSFNNQARQFIMNINKKIIDLNSGRDSLFNNIFIEKIFKIYEKKNTSVN